MKVVKGLMAGWWMVAVLTLPGWGLAQTTQPAGQAGAGAAQQTGKSGGNAAPKVVYSVVPRYTDEAKKKKLQGTSVLSLTVDVDGVPQNVAVARSMADTVPEGMRSAARGLDENAVEAARQYRFQPAMSNGKPVPVSIMISVKFALF